jgi:hypothetical protein
VGESKPLRWRVGTDGIDEAEFDLSSLIDDKPGHSIDDDESDWC